MHTKLMSEIESFNLKGNIAKLIIVYIDTNSRDQLTNWSHCVPICACKYVKHRSMSVLFRRFHFPSIRLL